MRSGRLSMAVLTVLVSLSLNGLSATVAYWNDQTSGTTFTDLSGNGNHLTSGANFSSSGVELISPVPNPDPAESSGDTETNGSIYMSGDETGVKTASSAPFKLTTTGSWTFEGWLKTTQTGGTITIAGDRHSSSSYQGWWFTLRSDGKIQFYFTTGTASSIASTTVVNDDNPYHFALVWDHAAGEMRLYVDGNLEGTASPTVGSYTQGAGFGIGGRAKAGDNVYNDDIFVGRLDELRFSDVALSTNQFLSYDGADTNAPVVSALSPTNNATGVLVHENLVATFDEDIFTNTTGSVVITNLTAGTSTVIAIGDTNQISVAGTVLTVTPTNNFAYETTYAVLIDTNALADAATNFFAGITTTAEWAFVTGGQNVMSNSGSWSTAGNWSKGSMPSGSDTAIINTNISVTSGAPSAYNGDLILREGAAINLGSVTSVGNFFPSGPASQAYLYEGSLLEFRDGTISIPMTLSGNATIQKQDQGVALNINSPISGSGHLTYQVKYWNGRELKVNNSAASTYTGGTTMEQHPSHSTSEARLLVYRNRAFGTGDVTINGRFIMQLMGSTTDVIDDGANLYITGSLAKFDLQNDSETLNKLFIDGVQQTAGTWGATGSGCEHTNDTHFAGSGVLTVLGLGPDTEPPFPNPMTFADLPAPLTTTSIVMTATTATDSTPPISYLFTNDTTGASSGWQNGTTWTNNVPADSVNEYRVMARDNLGNETVWSDPFSQSPFINNVMTTSGIWATGGNWSQGYMPTNTQTAIINTNVVVSYNAAAPEPYTGNLVLREGGEINLGDSGSVGNYIPGGAASEVHLYENSLLEFRDGTISKPITLFGNATIQKLDQGVALNINSPISGSGHLTYQVKYWSGRELKVNNSETSTYTGGTTLEPHPAAPTSPAQLWIYNNGALGTGDVTINGTAASSILSLMGSTTDVIDDTATLYLVGSGAQFDMNNDSETVYKLFIDGVEQRVGTWGATGSGCAHTNDTHFAGSGVLTVLRSSSATVFRFR